MAEAYSKELKDVRSLEMNLNSIVFQFTTRDTSSIEKPMKNLFQKKNINVTVVEAYSANIAKFIFGNEFN